jgi:pimeloyl-ACP methyl ester carboxylesterase
MPSMTLPSGGILAYRDAGSGTPLILIHGSPGEGRSWSRVGSRLVARQRILIPDLPGYGGSDPLPDGTLGRTAAMGAASTIGLAPALSPGCRRRSTRS